MENTKTKELFKNIIIFGIGVFGAKAMQMLLVPLYTSYMSTGEFGVADIIISTISLVLPIFMLGVENAIVPFVLGKEQNQKNVLKLSLSICIIGTMVLMLIVYIWDFKIFEEYEYMIPLLYFVSTLKLVLLEFCKGIEKNLVFAVGGIIEVIALTLLSILFLAVLELGIIGYLLAILISHCVVILYLAITCPILQTLKGAKFNDVLNKEIFSYAVPLIPNELSWWGIQMSDRYMITFFCGSAMNGLYSMAYKIPGIFNLLVSIFIKAFKITAIKECDMNKMDGGKYDGSYFSRIYESYMSITFLTVVLVIFITKPVAAIFLQKDFFESWVYVPLLLCAYAIGNLQAFYGSIYSGIRKSKPISLSTFIGMGVNIVLNLALIPQYGAYGAAIATITGYFFVYLIRMVCIKKYVFMEHFELKAFASIALVLAVSIFYIQATWNSYMICAVLYGVLIIMYRKNIAELFYKFIHTLGKVK